MVVDTANDFLVGSEGLQTVKGVGLVGVARKFPPRLTEFSACHGGCRGVGD
jgi:hypothetical protein